MASISAWTGASPIDLLKLPSDFREEIAKSLSDKVQADNESKSKMFSAFFKSLGKMFSSKKR